ncbi:MAG: 3-oxoacyl-ACP synthase [Prevotella sp.]|nr:3-oxoacyl-ACP synthase [Prevotella sp.]
MIYRLADNIISPLGETTDENYQAVKEGRSALNKCTGKWGVPDSYTASFFTQEQEKAHFIDGLTRFESLAFLSASRAVKDAGIDAGSSQTLFILSTTKANIELLSDDAGYVALYPGEAAERIAKRLGVSTPPIVVCNACISGVSAIILAMRLLEAKVYTQAIVCGADVLSKFTVSGFLSLKALAEDECRPFDIERLGLNLGEAAATLVLQRGKDVAGETVYSKDVWHMVQGAIRNDAFHVSSPSKNGEGAKLALEAVLDDVPKEHLALVNAHGTATMFNDQMESVAMERVGLNSVPVNALKGYFGHTLGAAGVLETIITMAALDDNTILATRGFSERGVSGKILVSTQNTQTSKTGFIKMISGFGGCNAALFVDRTGHNVADATLACHSQFEKVYQVRISPSSVMVDGKDVDVKEKGAQLLTWLYKQYVGDYPKFYKMDGLCQLGFVASELLLMQEEGERFAPCDNRAVILMNHSSSVSADRKFLASISKEDDFFPSPSAFIYTLPNIVTGEIAIRNHYHGETSFFIVKERNDVLLWQIVSASANDARMESVLGGWIDYDDENHFEADIFLAVRKTREESSL